jgi:hypothetical protein
MNFNESVHKELNKLFLAINKQFYDGELETPNILVQSVGKKNGTGIAQPRKCGISMVKKLMKLPYLLNI